MDQVYTGAINPFALGEAVIEKNIKWNSIQEPEKMLAEILDLDENEIFDAKNPILVPRIQFESDGSAKTLSEIEAKTRLENFIKERPSRNITRTVTRKLEVSPNRARISELLFPSSEIVESNSTPWNPTGVSWIDKGDYFEDVTELNDPIQGSLGDCYFIAALSSVVWSRPYVIVNALRPSANRNPIHRITFYNNNKAESVEVGEAVPVNKSNHSWIYARSYDTSEIWPAVIEKAYAKWRTKNTTDFPDYRPLGGGDPVLACAQLIGGSPTYKNHPNISTDSLLSFVKDNSLNMRTVNPMVAWTYGAQPSGTNYASARVVASHAYSVLGWDYYNGEYYIVLRNPWGTYPATLATRSGTWRPYYISYYADIVLNADGVFAMKVATYKQYFAGTGVAK
jgi:Calpain family cysteine protease.